MAVNVKAKGRQSTSVHREAEGEDVFLRALRDGTVVMADWREAAVEGGRGYMVNIGDITTGIQGGGGDTIVDLDAPEFVLAIPNGTAIRPLRISVELSSMAPVDSEEQEILIAVDQDKTLSATSIAGSTYTAETIYNMNTLKSSVGSNCTAFSAFTDTITADPALDLILARKVCELLWDTDGYFGAVMVDLLYEPVAPPIINGPACLILYWGGDSAVTGFAEIQWLEFAEGDFSI